MICLLGEPEDRDLLWLAAALRRRTVDVEFVLPEELMVDSALTCRIDRTGVESSLRLKDGRELGAGDPTLVINRLADLPRMNDDSGSEDVNYLAEEWRAVLAAWLRTLRCPVLNPPRAASLSGPVLPTAMWCAIAHAHGLATRPWHSSEAGAPLDDELELVCVGAECIDRSGLAPENIGVALIRMSRFVNVPLFGATFDRRDGRWLFVDGTPWPGLARGGEPIVDALVRCTREVALRR